jgi:hypothetical protein
MYNTRPTNSSFNEVWVEVDGRPGDDFYRGQWFGSMESARYEDSTHCSAADGTQRHAACLLDTATCCMPAGHSDMLHAWWTQRHAACLVDTATRCMPGGHSDMLHAWWTQRHAACLLDTATCCLPAGHSDMLFACWT